MKKNTDLLSEELKRHKRLVEYTFFMEDDDLDTDKPKDDRKILLGMKNEADPEMDPAAPDAEAPEGGAPAGPDAGAEGGEAPVDMQVADEPQADPNAGAQGMGGDAGAAGLAAVRFSDARRCGGIPSRGRSRAGCRAGAATAEAGRSAAARTGRTGAAGPGRCRACPAGGA